MKDRQFFEHHPVFTHAEYLDAVTGRDRASRRTVDSQLRYHVEAGNLLRIRRGLYASVPPARPGSPDSVNPLLVASKLSPDTVLAYHSALQFHGCALTILPGHQILTEHPWRAFTYGSCRYQAVAIPKALGTAEQQAVGIQEFECEGLPIFVTSRERTLVDVLDRPELSGGWVELWRSIEKLGRVDLDQVVAYARLLGNPTVFAKVGLCLELNSEELGADDEIIDLFKAQRPSTPQPMVRPRRPRRESVRLLRRWNLIVPTVLLERPWDDPDLQADGIV